ncbi:MAG: hypothetical protein QHG99_07455 [Methanomicrobiales archaeon]|nr:hypothetical protein [Methanomicrobiales archaeon]
MKRSAYILLICLLIGFICPVSADFFTDLNEKVIEYNSHASNVPDPIKMVLGNDEIYGVITLNDGSTLLVRAVTKDAYITEFSKVAEKVKVERLEYSAADALAALRMSVGKTQEDSGFDVDGDGRISSKDARIILQYAVGLSSETNPTLVLTTDEGTARSIMYGEEPVKAFFAAYDSGALKIEGVGIVKMLTVAVGNAFLTIARMIGIVKI